MTSGGGMGGQADVLYVDVVARTDERSLRQMEQEVEAAGTQAGQKGGAGLKGAFGSVLGSLPGMAVAVAAAVGAALVSGGVAATRFAQQARQGVIDIQSSLGSTREEAERLGEIAKKVFGNNWTGSLAEAQQAVINVRKEIRGLAEEDVQAVTEGTLAIAEKFEEEQSRVAAAVQAVMNATGASAQEAMDFITAGFQKGLNSSGDFLDTLTEYSPQFKKAQIDGGELFSLLETGAAKGALGTDKIADAFKEFGLTVVEVSDTSKAAYAELGLNHQKIVDQINAGTLTQAEAFQLVTERLKGVQGQADRTRIGAAIFGGAGEDMAVGLQQLDLTKTKLSDLSGSTQQVKDATNTLPAVFQTAWRQLLIQLQPIGDLVLDLANEALPHVQAAIEASGPYVQQFVRFLVDGFRQGREAADGARPYLEKVGSAVQALGPLFQAVFRLIVALWENVLRPAFQAILPIVTTVFGSVADVVGVAIRTVTSIVNAVAALLRGDWAAAWQFLKDAAVTAFVGLQNALDGMGNKLIELGSTLGKKLLEGMQSGLDGLQAMILAALARALENLGDRLPAILKPLAQRLAGAAQEAADRNAQDATTHDYNAQNGSYNGAGQFGSFASLRAGLGVDKYGTSPDYAGHTGKDIRTPVGTPLYAPVGAKVEMGFEKDGYGLFLKLTDKDGYKLYLAHLSGISTELVNQIKKTGSAFVNAGTFLGKSGGDPRNPNSQNSTGPHLHAEVRAPNNTVQNLDRFRVGIPNPQNPLTPPRPTNTPPTTGGGQGGSPTPPPQPTVPLPDPTEQKTYNLTLTDWNKLKEKALDLSRRLAAAEESRNYSAQLQIQAEIRAWTKGNEARAGAVAFAQKVVSEEAKIKPVEGPITTAQITKAQQLVAALDAAQKSHDPRKIDAAKTAMDTWSKASESNARALSAVQASQSGLNKSAGEYVATTRDFERYGNRALVLIKAQEAAQKSGSAQQIAAADAAVKAFEGQGRAQASVLGAERAAYQSRQQARQQEELAGKTASANRLAAERALADGQITLAKGKANEVITQYDREVRAAGSDADARLTVEQRLGKDVLAARDTLARASAREEVTRLERERNAAVNVQGLTLRQRQDLWAQYSGRIAQVNRDLAGVIEENAGASTRSMLDLQIAAGQTASDLVDREIATVDARFQNLQAVTDYSQRLKYGNGDVGLIRSLAAATGYSVAKVRADVEGALTEARRLSGDTASTIERVYADALTHRREVAAEQRRIDDQVFEAAKGNAARIHDTYAAEQAAADDASITVEYLNGLLTEILAQGRDPEDTGFIAWLQDLAAGSGQAAAAATDLLTRWERMAEVRRQMHEGPLLDASPARPTPDPARLNPFTPDAPMSGPVEARGTHKGEEPVTASGPRVPADLGKAWDEFQRKAGDTAWLKETAERLKGLDAAQLATAKSAAFASKNVAEYSAILDEEERRAKVAADSVKLISDAETELAAITTGEALPAFEVRARALEAQAKLDETHKDRLLELAAAIRTAGQAAQDQKDRLDVTVKIHGLDTGLKQLDLYKSAVQGVADIIQGAFTDLVSGTSTGVEGILVNMAKMALGIVKSVAVSIAAYQAQAIALALISGASFNFVQAGLALAAAAAVAGIAAGLEARLSQQQQRQASATSSSPASSAGTSSPGEAPNSNVTIPTSQVTVAATPEALSILAAAAKDFREGVGEFREVLRGGVRVNVETSASGAGDLAWDLTTGGL